jgi:hypothetical protein
MNFKNILYYLYIILSVVVLEFSTIFWIGSKEDFEILKRNTFSFFSNRFILNFIAIFFILLFLVMVRLLFKQNKTVKSNKNILAKTFFILIISSILLIIINHYL